jgi:hypothetical protein
MRGQLAKRHGQLSGVPGAGLRARDAPGQTAR